MKHRQRVFAWICLAKEARGDMLRIYSLEDISALKESVDVECKLVHSKESTDKISESFYETYSAFANTESGDIFLGLRENSYGNFERAGIKNTQKIIDEIWTKLNNPKKVSANILQYKLIRTLAINGKIIVQVHIPQASNLYY